MRTRPDLSCLVGCTSLVHQGNYSSADIVGAWLHFFAHQFGVGVVQAYQVLKVLRISRTNMRAVITGVMLNLRLWCVQFTQFNLTSQYRE